RPETDISSINNKDATIHTAALAVDRLLSM
ncbi:hypothetical protein J2Z84_001689, partial [Agrobacterium rubi]|nr:hypothetical protein [Agrobacterium rubi]